MVHSVVEKETKPNSSRVMPTSVVLAPRQQAWLNRQVARLLEAGELAGDANRSAIIRELIDRAMAEEAAGQQEAA